MALKDIIITASINSYPTLSYGQKTFIASTDEQSFPVEVAIGGQAGVWPDFNGQYATTNLFVNISQSWSGSNITPVGIVPFIHNTEEEFFNGEFSGSILDVTDGNLTDPDCKSVLQVNTTSVDYSVSTFYKNTIGFDQFPALLNVFTTPNAGEAYLGLFNFTSTKSYAMYAKIARIDALGNDNTLSLQELKQFRYTDTTAGELICNVVNITEYPDYYLYEVTSNTLNVFPTNINVVNYDFSATSAPSQVLGISTDFLVSPSTNWTVSTDTAGGFNSGFYTFSGTPNTSINFTISGQFTPPSGVGSQTMYFGIADVTDYLSQGIAPTAISYTTALISSANQLVTHNVGITSFASGRIYCIFVTQQIFGATAGMTVNTLTWDFVSAPAQTAQNFFILEPYLISNFKNTDCDVLMNNYSENDYSRFYREVLYDNGGTIPSNFEQIINGTAQFAEINDYLFNASANTLPRYYGVRTTSANVNQYSIDGLSNEELSNISDSSQLVITNGTPNVENLQTYFASFNYFQGTTGELLDKSAAHITYLIDKDGTVFTPSLSSSYYWNLIDNFETDKNTNIIIYNKDGDKVTLGNKRILRPGALPRAIIESQIGYDSKVINNISFGTSTDIADEGFDYYFVAAYGPLGDTITVVPITSNPDGEGGEVIPFTLILSGSDSPTIDLNGGNFTLKTKKGNDSILLQLKLTLVASKGSGGGNFTPLISFQYSDDDGTSWTSFYEDNSQTFNAGGSANIYTSTAFSPVKDRLYRVYFSWYDSSGNGQIYLRSEMPNVVPGYRTQLEVLQQTGGPNIVRNYSAKYKLDNTYIFGNGDHIFPLYAIIQNGYPNIDLNNPAPSRIKILESSNRSKLNFYINTKSQVPGSNGSSGVIELQKSTDGGTTYSVISSIIYYMGNDNGSYFNNAYTFNVNETPVAGNLYKFIIKNTSGYSFQFSPDCYVQVTQTNSTVPLLTNPTSASIYWTTGSTPSFILSSSYFAPYWTGDAGSYTQNSISNIYGPNLPFVIQPYTDQIRFEGDETQVYTIVDVGFDPNQNSGFNTDFNTWTYNGPNWSSNIAGTVASCIGGGDYISQTITSNLILNDFYSLTFQVINYVGGDLVIDLDGASTLANITANGTYSFSIPAGLSPHTLAIRSWNFIGSITNIQFESSGPFIYIRLDRSVAPDTNINSFLIRRYHPNPNFVTIDSSVISGSGFLLPEYVTNDIKQNFDKIIVNIRERGLI